MRAGGITCWVSSVYSAAFVSSLDAVHGCIFSELFLCLRLCKPDWSEELLQAGDKDGCAESRVT